MKFRTVELLDGASGPVVRLIDQRKLPASVEYVDLTTLDELCDAILDMTVRGAPAIGAAAAYGMLIGAWELKKQNKNVGVEDIRRIKERLDAVRPTAVNLSYGTGFVLNRVLENSDDIMETIKVAAQCVYNEDVKSCFDLSTHGASLISDGDSILTHCNAGALATTEHGTAVGVIKFAHDQGKNISVYADETRPKLQGSRLTAWELVSHGVPVTILPDSAAATLIRDGKVDLVITGADRIAANGDTANKIGTFGLSALCQIYDIPFYIAAPYSTIDFSLEDGKNINIEIRDGDELRYFAGVQIAPNNCAVYNPAFDVTPHWNIRAIITEKGIVYPPFKENLEAMKR